MRKKKSNQPSDFELDKYGVWVKTKLGSSFDTTQNIEKEVERTEPPRSFTPQKNDSFTFDSIHTQIENIKKDLSDLKNEIKDSKIENFSLFSNKPVDFFADHPSLKSESNSSDFGIGSLSKTDDLLSDFDTSEQNNNPTEKDKQDAELSSSIDSLFTDDLELTEEDIRSFDEETQPTCVNDKFDFFDEKNIEETLPEEATSDLILDPLEDFDLPEEKEIEFPKAKESDEDNDFFDIFNFNFKEPEESDKQKEEQPLEEVTSSDEETIFDNEHFSFFDDNKIAPTEEPIVEEPIVEEPIVEEPIVEEPIVEEPIVEEPFFLSEDNTDLDDIGFTDTEGINTIQPGINDGLRETAEEPVVENDELGTVNGVIHLHEDEPTEEQSLQPDKEETEEETLTLSDNELLSLLNTNEEITDEKTESVAPRETAADEFSAVEPETEEERAFFDSLNWTSEEPIVEEPTVEEPTVEEPIVEEPIVEEPIVEEPIVEEPIVEEPTVEEPTVEEPTVEEPTVEEPTVEEPTVEENRQSKNRQLKNRLSKIRQLKNRQLKNRLSKIRQLKIRQLKNRLLKNRLLKNRLLKNRLLKNRLLKNRQLKNRQLKNRLLKNRLSKNRLSKNRQSKIRQLKIRQLKIRQLKNRLSKNRLSKNRLSKNRLSKNRLSKNRLSKIRLLKIRLPKNRKKIFLLLRLIFPMKILI